MAAVAQSAVTFVRRWEEAGPANKDVKCAIFDIVLSSQGGATNYIGAALFGLTKIEQAGPLVKNDSSLALVAVPSYDGTKLLVLETGSSTVGNHDNPADASGTFRGWVKGY